FPIADKLAASLNFSSENPLRLEAGLIFELTHHLDNGHVFLPRAKLLEASARLMNVDPAALPDQLNALITRKMIVFDPIAGEEACYLTKLHTAECYVANQLLRMADRVLLPPPNQDALIAKLQKDQNIHYAPLQIQAIQTAATRQLMLLTGGPGTGKTTSLRGVLALFDQLGFHTALVAPTGRAAKRLAETCDAEASTIHRLLETRYDPKQSTLVFSHNEQNPIDADAVIVDEVSMVDLPLMHALIAALPNDCRMILVGDPNQLPSVGPGNLLSDLLRSQRLPTLCLTEIFRQAASSTIVQNAYHVNHGEIPPLTNSSDKDCFFLRRIDPNTALDTIVDLCLNRLPNKLSIPPDQIQVLSPTRRGITGTASLNHALQAALNPPAIDKPERVFGSQLFRLGDRVMQIKNNYDLIWEDHRHAVGGMGVFNGDIGQITELDSKGGILTVDFDGHLAEYPLDIWNQLEPAYAITVHKSQGSEYRAVILCVTDAAPMLLTRSVLYTAMTRAKALLILVGDEHIVARMTASDRQQRRYSGLSARLAEERR
ncbi:MAG: AAA family ATPase, partial [Evtepia sp.]